MLRSKLGLRSKHAGSSFKLCDVCQTIDLAAANFIVRSGENKAVFEERYNLGVLYDICQKQSCPLCRLVVQAAGGSDSAQNDAARGIKCQLYWQEDGFLYSSEEPQVRCLRLSAQPWPCSFNEMNRLVFVADRDRATSTRSSLFFGRVLPHKQVDFEQMKMWLYLCAKWHGEDCDVVKLAEVKPLKSLPYFKVIDVKRRCVVDAPSDCRYCALSYVWGSVKAVELTKAHDIDLEKSGSLLACSNTLPATVKDAIELVARLGERYLWIDSLCVVQDDLATKAALVNNMDQIYAQAFLTIVAAGGGNANAGLNGVRRESRGDLQKVEKVAAGVRLIYSQHLSDSLGKAIYQSRAWTYQERFFSRRCLFFVDGQVVFQCRDACWREDIFAEGEQVSMSFDMTGINNFDSLDTTSPHGDYVGCLYQFTRRNITYDWDILNAFAGISTFLEGRLHSKMRCGLPDSVFDWSILWGPSQGTHRRPCFPSWSWAGWIGGMEMPGGGWSGKELQDWLSNHSWIVWYMRDAQGGEPIRVGQHQHNARNDDDSRPKRSNGLTQTVRNGESGQPNSRFSCASKTRPVSTPKPRQQEVNDMNDRALRAPYSLLQFWTISAKFSISNKDIIHHLAVPGLSLFGIYDSAGVLSGEIWLNEGFRGNTNEENEFEFIMLSDAKASDINHQDYHNSVSNKGKSNQVQDAASTHEPGQIYDEIDHGTSAVNGLDESCWTLYNVMLIEWHDGVAERLGIGKLYQKALRHAFSPGPHWKEIVLG